MNDLDPQLRDAMSRVRGPVNARPSLTDVRRRARRHNRRRMTATVGAVACTGVATAALIIRRDSTAPAAVGQSESAEQPAADELPTTTYLPLGNQTTTTVYGAQDLTIRSSTVWDALWNARYDPAGAGLVVEPTDQAAADVMPTPEQFGCTSNECRAMFAYVVWHEIAKTLGYYDVSALRELNPSVDFSQPPREGDVLHSCCGVTPQSTIYVPAPDIGTTTTTSVVIPTSTSTPGTAISTTSTTIG